MKEHDLPSGKVEDVINCHDEVAESAVVQYQSPSRGNVPLAYVILKLDNSAEAFDHHKDGSANDPKCCSYLNDAGKSGQKMSSEMKLAFDKIANEIKQIVIEEIGEHSELAHVIFVKRVPKTRNGQILR